MKITEELLHELSKLCMLINEDKLFIDAVDEISEIIVDTLKSGKTIFACGNGGSYTTAAHLCEELVGRYRKNRKPLSAICLGADVSALTCIANDFGFDSIFSRELSAHAKKDDCLIVFSTSGDSPNIINALKTAQDMGVYTIGLLGKNGGEAKKYCSKPLIVPHYKSERIQEIHTFILHVICEAAEMEFANDSE